ncbi:MAG TPA: TadE/TadG family type IV pilus assembly protein [Candidatus Eisenbacteria bacterium]|nr:TadE/TadG family type IV pilus assembly protein [Candidatus Eisenbacteria bacterium]
MNLAQAADGRRNQRPAPHPESGVALIEFAFVLPILLVLAMGMLDFGRAFHTKSLLDQAAREGARVAVVTTPDLDIVQNRVSAVLASGGITPTSVTVDGPDAANMVTVTVNATFTFITPGVFALVGGSYGNTIPMAGQTVMRFEG